MSIGTRLRQLRLQNNLTQEQVGEICEITKGMVSQWESDMVTPPSDRLIKLRSRVNFSIDWLLLGDTDYASNLRPTLRELLKVAEPLPDKAVASLTREGDTYAKLIKDAREREIPNGTNG